MVSKLLSNAALLTTIAQAVAMREVLDEEVSDSQTWEFAQVWQDRSVRHTCSAAHDRVKATPQLDLNLMGSPVTSTEPNSPAVEEELEPLPPLKLDPKLFERITVRLEPFKSKCAKPKLNEL